MKVTIKYHFIPIGLAKIFIASEDIEKNICLNLVCRNVHSVHCYIYLQMFFCVWEGEESSTIYFNLKESYP